MRNFWRFFYLTPRDLKIQPFTVGQIAERMKRRGDEERMPLPRGFASSMRAIINNEEKSRGARC